MPMGLDKTKKKNWIDGDAFAIKIENNSKGYNGRYIILIKTSYDNNLENSVKFYFRAKLTKNNILPTSEEELNKLEYIKTGIIPYIERLLPITMKETLDEALKRVDSENTFYKDEYGYLTEYRVLLYMKRGGNYSNFVYLGNYDLLPPKDEFVSASSCCYYLDNFPELPNLYFVNKLLENYEDYNLKRSYKYTKKGREVILKNAQEHVELLYNYAENLINNKNINQKKLTIINGWGPKLYDSDVALDIKEDYIRYLRKSKKNNQSNDEMIKELCDYYEDYINDSVDGPLFWIILSDQQMKNRLLTKEQKKKALESIEKDLYNWKEKEKYQERKKELDSLKEDLENYIFKDN